MNSIITEEYSGWTQFNIAYEMFYIVDEFYVHLIIDIKYELSTGEMILDFLEAFVRHFN